MPPDMDGLKSVVAATKKPVNALAAGPYTKVTQAEFAAAGVARISLGSAIANATQKTIHTIAAAMFDDGRFDEIRGISGKVVDDLLGR